MELYVLLDPGAIAATLFTLTIIWFVAPNR